MINNNSNELTLLSNGITIASGIPIPVISPAVYPLYLGTDIGTKTKNYIGKIDNFNIISNNFNISTNEYISTNNIGVISTLSGFVYRKKLQFQEIVSISGLWKGIQTWFPSQSINDEYLFNFIDTNTTYIGTLNSTSIVPKYLQIKHQVIVGGVVTDVSAIDDGNGNILGSYIYGTIDYNNSNYTIYPYLKNNVYQHIIASTAISGISNHFLNYDLIPSTFNMFYEITGTSYIAQDDGTGNVVGTGITYGNLNYSTGQLNVIFSQPTQSGFITSCNHSYKTIPTIPSGSLFMSEYKVNDKLLITECAIENSNKEVLIYESFPNVMASDIYNEISIGTLIKL